MDSLVIILENAGSGKSVSISAGSLDGGYFDSARPMHSITRNYLCSGTRSLEGSLLLPGLCGIEPVAKGDWD